MEGVEIGSDKEINVLINPAVGVATGSNLIVDGTNPKDLATKGVLVSKAKNARAGEYIITITIRNATTGLSIPTSLYGVTKIYVTN